MKKIILLCAFCVCLAVHSQTNIFGTNDDGTTTNNWNLMPELAPVEASWDYALTPGWYFYFGMGVGVFVGMTGVMVRVFQTVTGAGDAGGDV